jgi:hypothetical protein
VLLANANADEVSCDTGAGSIVSGEGLVFVDGMYENSVVYADEARVWWSDG